MSAARARRFSTCKCCGALTASALCDSCGDFITRGASLSSRPPSIAAIWGGRTGSADFRTELAGPAAYLPGAPPDQEDSMTSATEPREIEPLGGG